jgi:hypothetical protein
LRIAWDLQLQDEFNEWVKQRFDPFREHLKSQWNAIAHSMQTEAPDLDDYPLPQPKNVQERKDCLYNSMRSYLEQLAAYQEFTGKFAHLISNEDEEGVV